MENTPTSGKQVASWTDKERLIYLFALLEQAGTKPDFKNTPRPTNRTEIACERMVGRLKSSIKDELEALKAGTYNGESTTPKKATPKRKAAPVKTTAGDVADDEGSPKKKGRKKAATAKSEAVIKDEDGEGEMEDPAYV